MNGFTVHADLEPIRDFQARDEGTDFDRESVLLIAALQAIHADGESEMRPGWWPGILSHAANWREGDTVASQTRRLLAIRPLVNAQGDPAVLAEHGTLLAAARQGLLRGDERTKPEAFGRQQGRPDLLGVEPYSD